MNSESLKRKIRTTIPGKNGINFITNLPERLTDCDFKEKQKIIGSIFPEKLQFDGKKVRTAFGKILRSFGNKN